MTEEFQFLEDIQNEPDALKRVIEGYDPSVLAGLRARQAAGEFDRIIITGMGTSYFGTYSAWMHLVEAGLPAFWMDTSELITYFPHLITSKTLLWIVSNSGKSIEITRLLKRLEEFGNPFILANVNVMESPLAKKAGLLVPIFSGDDLTLATRSLVATLAVTQLMALQLAGAPIDQALKDLKVTCEGIREFISHYESHLVEFDRMVGKVDRVAIVGRGKSYGSALAASLCFKEGPKVAGEGIATGQFWHGPVELADSSYTVFTYQGEKPTREEDLKLALKAQSLGAKVIWLANREQEGLPTIVLPKYQGIGLPIAQIIPIQLIAINLGKQTHFRPGDFRYLGFAVTTKKEMFQ